MPSNKMKNKRIKYYPNSATEFRDSDLEPVYSIVYYDGGKVIYKDRVSSEECTSMQVGPEQIAWIDVDGLRRKVVQNLAYVYHIHPLIQDDILSFGQRAKMDEIDGKIYCLLPMLQYDETSNTVQIEQISIVVSENIVLTFQGNPKENPLAPLKKKLTDSMAFRSKQTDFLLYMVIDNIVDKYFTALDKLEARLTSLEEKSLKRRPPANIVFEISNLRHELMNVKRAISPVRDLVSGLYRTENTLIEDRNKRFFKDVLDHILLAIEYNDNYREITVNIQDLYMNQVNTRMNEIMKILTVVTVLLAPATVVGSVFGMNFDIIPLVHLHYGFYLIVAIMFLATFGMVIWFRRKDWF